MNGDVILDDKLSDCTFDLSYFYNYLFHYAMFTGYLYTIETFSTAFFLISNAPASVPFQSTVITMPEELKFLSYGVGN